MCSYDSRHLECPLIFNLSHNYDRLSVRTECRNRRVAVELRARRVPTIRRDLRAPETLYFYVRVSKAVNNIGVHSTVASAYDIRFCEP